jgi:hypothetical protein
MSFIPTHIPQSLVATAQEFLVQRKLREVFVIEAKLETADPNKRLWVNFVLHRPKGIPACYYRDSNIPIVTHKSEPWEKVDLTRNFWKDIDEHFEQSAMMFASKSRTPFMQVKKSFEEGRFVEISGIMPHNGGYKFLFPPHTRKPL